MPESPNSPPTDAELLADPADRELDRREAEAILSEELRRLPANERAVLFRKLKEGRSHREISAITGLGVVRLRCPDPETDNPLPPE
jgi:DNA-directed RNA polymerase specialized sigma24 family protein